MFRISTFFSMLLILFTTFTLARAGNSYVETASELVDNNLYFTAVPYMKEYLAVGGVASNSRVEDLIDEIITNTGVRQFEVFPIRILERSNAPIIRYILAKKYFRRGKYDRALGNLRKKISTRHSVKPFALLLEASIHAIQKRYASAVKVYKQCVNVSNMHIKREGDPNRSRQLSVNRDNCIVGIPRAQFAAKKHNVANLSYLDLSKESYIWPEILFEEAWNSFYMEDYNRTLGKLVTYKAPVFDYIFNPEVDVLRALSYLHLCLYKDVKKTIDEYYSRYEKETDRLHGSLRRYGKNYKLFFSLADKARTGKLGAKNRILGRMLKAILRDPAYIEQRAAYSKGLKEIEALSNLDGRRKKREFLRNLKTSLELQRDLIGSYVRKNLYMFISQLNKGFEGMSSIGLEINYRRKERIYRGLGDFDRTRGDVKYLKRNDKQYYWSFNGEFWADELGDYVFALRSECSK